MRVAWSSTGKPSRAGMPSWLEAYYVPMIAGCIIPSDRTIDDVLYAPTDYAYPAVFIHCAIT